MSHTFRMNTPARLRALAFAVLAALAATASAGTPDVRPEVAKAITAAIHKASPNDVVTSITPSPVSGLYTVISSGRVVYVSGDGTYLIQGNLYNLREGKDLTSVTMNVVRKAALRGIPEGDKIRFAPKDPKYHVTVFTDIDCGYCRKLHSHIDQYNKDGIAVDYLSFPRTGINSASYDKAVSVWCAKDRKAALTDAKLGNTPAPAKCDNPVAMEYALGAKIGVNGTPAIIADNGALIGGYLTPDQMLSKLQAIKNAK